MDKKVNLHENMPLLPLRDIVVYPYMVVPLFVGREKSILAIEHANFKNKIIFLAAQKKSKTDDPTIDDIYQMGTIAEILQILRLPDGAIKVLVEGLIRGKIKDYIEGEKFFQVKVESFSDTILKNPEIEAIMRNLLNLFEEYVSYDKRLVPAETLHSISSIEEPGRLADIISAHLILKIQEKQSILEEIDTKKRLFKLAEILSSENEILKIEKKIRGRVRTQMEKSQKEYYLNEQMKAIQKELGYKDEHTEIIELREKIKKANMSHEAEEASEKEIKRLEKMPPMSAEATVIRNYVDWLLELPWNIYTDDKIDIQEAEKILDRDHFGLKKIKERILEFLAVRKLVKKGKGPILCFVGPPGVGKTSLAKSISSAMNRNFVRISLGGVKDEAEIRGHRRTYIGAMPGKIIQCMKKAKSINPVFLLDEVDKMSMDFRGDPSSALLEVLDPEQNFSFNDHYIEVDFDLSDVMFITTANVLTEIPAPLRDRMEIITLPGYTEWEKANIAEKFLIPKCIKEHGLKKNSVSFSPAVIHTIIRKYTREAGVRNLEREIASICRKVAKQIVKEKENKETFIITNRNLESYLGVYKYHSLGAEEKDEVGVATGLAWTEVGGEILSIETTIMKGKGSLILTGKLGEVMQESARAALSYIRSHAKILGIEEDFYRKFDIHVHVPEGAIPKDGPSAGISICTSIISALTNTKVRKDVAMTGEITLRGKVLPIGGVKEKVLAAHRCEIKTVILPKLNEKDIKDIPMKIRQALKFVIVEIMDEVLKEALVNNIIKDNIEIPVLKQNNNYKHSDLTLM
ncbi:MAG: endopeptidase La [Candidatus Firestonebacteria bacterium]|nr:endopeptidase La [Candidatus Firestonebacteria bacterium]